MEFASFPIPAPTPAAKPAVTQADAVTAEKAQEFEAMFLSQAVDEMLKSVDMGAFAGGETAEMWRSFMAQAVADQIAQQGRTGIAQSIQTSISAYQTGTSQSEETSS